MAKSSSKPPKVTQIRESDTAESEQTTTSTAVMEPPPAVEAPPVAKPAASSTSTKKPPKTISFFDRIASIDKADWGTRAKIKIYRLAPLINRLVSSENKYITIYDTGPITEEQIKVDHGSGKYRLYFNWKAPAEGEKELDSVEIDILDPRYPPNIPGAEWLDDPRNKEWQWARNVIFPGGTPNKVQPPAPPATGAETVLEGIRLGNELRKEAREELKAETPAATTTTPSPVDPWDAASKILNMRSENPMVDILRDELKAMREEMKEARKEARDREFQLQTELRQAQAAPAASQSKGLLTELVELAASVDKLEPVKKLFGLGGTASETVTRAASAKPLDVVRDLGRDFFNSDLSRDIGRWLGSLAERNMATNPATNGMNGNGAVAQRPASDPFAKFIEEIVNPKMVMYFNADPSRDGGESFADWIYAGFPEFFTRLQAFEHPRLPGLKGAAAIITGYKNTPHIWNQIGPTREVQFAEFVNGFCEWKRPEEEPVEDAEVVEPSPDAPIDFDAQYARETRPS